MRLLFLNPGLLWRVRHLRHWVSMLFQSIRSCQAPSCRMVPNKMPVVRVMHGLFFGWREHAGNRWKVDGRSDSSLPRRHCDIKPREMCHLRRDLSGSPMQVQMHLMLVFSSFFCSFLGSRCKAVLFKKRLVCQMSAE